MVLRVGGLIFLVVILLLRVGGLELLSFYIVGNKVSLVEGREKIWREVSFWWKLFELLDLNIFEVRYYCIFS